MTTGHGATAKPCEPRRMCWRRAASCVQEALQVAATASFGTASCVLTLPTGGPVRTGPRVLLVPPAGQSQSVHCRVLICESILLRGGAFTQAGTEADASVHVCVCSYVCVSVCLLGLAGWGLPACSMQVRLQAATGGSISVAGLPRPIKVLADVPFPSLH